MGDTQRNAHLLYKEIWCYNAWVSSNVFALTLTLTLTLTLSRTLIGQHASLCAFLSWHGPHLSEIKMVTVTTLNSDFPFRFLFFKHVPSVVCGLFWSSLFSCSFSCSISKKLLETTIARVQILRGRREVQLCHLLRQVAQLMNCGKNRKAQMQVIWNWSHPCVCMYTCGYAS